MLGVQLRKKFAVLEYQLYFQDMEEETVIFRDRSRSRPGAASGIVCRRVRPHYCPGPPGTWPSTSTSTSSRCSYTIIYVCF